MQSSEGNQYSTLIYQKLPYQDDPQDISIGIP